MATRLLFLVADWQGCCRVCLEGFLLCQRKMMSPFLTLPYSWFCSDCYSVQWTQHQSLNHWKNLRRWQWFRVLEQRYVMNLFKCKDVNWRCLDSCWEAIKKLKHIKNKQLQWWGWVKFIRTSKALSDGICDVHYPRALHSPPPHLSLINILFTSPPGYWFDSRN